MARRRPPSGHPRQTSALRRAVSALAALVLLAGALAGAWLYYFTHTPVRLPATPYEFTVHPGASLKAVARQLAADGVLPEPYTFWLMGRATGKSGAIQAGTYRLERALTPPELLDKLARGEVVQVE